MFCKQLVNMFRDKQMDVVFYEIATRFNRLPHMILHCVPLPRTIGNLAPVYFKKAILECEKEWAINKKLVNVQHMNVKRSVPKGLPYFMVHFGMDVGFAHVIENEKEFPTNFAEVCIICSCFRSVCVIYTILVFCMVKGHNFFYEVFQIWTFETF